jgi:paraquat-inducible protein B
VLDHADQLISSPEVLSLLQSVAHASNNLDRLVTALNADIDPLVMNVNQTMASAQDTMADARRALVEMRTTLATANHLMSTSIDDVAKRASATLQKADKLLADADGLVATNSPQRNDLDQTLRNLSNASRALRLFAEDLQRKPNNIVMGK